MEKVMVERVNDFEFLRNDPDKRKPEFQTYRYSFPAKVAVKIRNQIKEFTLELKEPRPEWLRNDGDPDEPYVVILESHLLKEWKEKLAELDFEPDFSKVFKEYEEALEEVKADDLRIRKERAEWEWDNSWVHDFIKEIKYFDSEVEAEISHTKEQYVDTQTDKKSLSLGGILSVRLTYKGIAESVTLANISTRSHVSELRYCLCGGITNYKSRNYAKISSLVKKFKELVNQEIARKERKREKEDEAKAVLDKITMLPLPLIYKPHPLVVSSGRTGSYFTGEYKVRIGGKDGIGLTATTRDGENFRVDFISETLTKEQLVTLYEKIKGFVAEL